MTEKDSKIWDNWHNYKAIAHNILCDLKTTKLPRIQRTNLAHQIYKNKYGKRYKRPGIAFNW